MPWLDSARHDLRYGWRLIRKSPLRAPIWVPYTMAAPFYAGRDLFREPATPWLLGMSGRLKPGSTRPAAASELQVLARHQDDLVAGRRTTIHVTSSAMIDAL